MTFTFHFMNSEKMWQIQTFDKKKMAKKKRKKKR